MGAKAHFLTCPYQHCNKSFGRRSESMVIKCAVDAMLKENAISQRQPYSDFKIDLKSHDN